MKTSGIYKIINKTNGKYYIGSSNDIRRRWSDHKSHLNKKRHRNIHLMNAWHKYGPNNFDFLIIKEVPLENLIEEEQRFLTEASRETDKCYNQYFTAYQIDWTDDRRKKASERMKGWQPTDAIREKLRQAGKRNGFKNHPPKKIISNDLREKILSTGSTNPPTIVKRLRKDGIINIGRSVVRRIIAEEKTRSRPISEATSCPI